MGDASDRRTSQCPSVSDIEQALKILYISSVESDRTAADVWLSNVQRSAFAWDVGRECVTRGTSAEMVYYGASTIYWFVKRGGVGDHGDLYILELFKLIVNSNNASVMTKERLFLSTACAIALSAARNGGDIQKILATTHDMRLDSNIILAVMGAVPEEISSAGLSPALEEKALEKLRSGVQAILFLIVGHLGDSVHDCRLMALKCLSTWCRVGVTLSDFTKTSSFGKIIDCLSNSDTAALASSSLCDLLKVVSYPEDTNTPPALQQLGMAIGCLENLFDPCNGDAYEDHCLAIVQVAIALVESRTEMVASDADHFGGMTKLLLLASCHPCSAVCATSFDAWLDIQTIPVAKRHPLFGKTLYANVFNVIVQRIAYPPQGWDASNIDEEDFKNLRESSAVVDVIETCGSILGSDALLMCCRFLCLEITPASGSLTRVMSLGQVSWQAVEAVLFSLRALATSMMSRFREFNDPASIPAISALQTLFSSMFRQIWGTNSLVQAAECQAIQSYSRFFSSSNELLGLAVKHLMYLLSSKEGKVSISAAKAFCALSRSSSDKLCRLPVMMDCISNLSVTPPSIIQWESRVFAYEALTRIISRLPDEEAMTPIQLLVRPIISRLRSLNDSGRDRSSYNVQFVESIAGEFRSLTQIVQFLEFSSPVALRAVVEEGWPVVQLLVSAALYDASFTIVTAICELSCKAILSSKEGFLPYLLQTMTFMSVMFKATLSPKCIECVSVAVEVFGKDAGMTQFLSSLVNDISSPVFMRLNADMESSVDLITEYLTLMCRLALFCPVALTHSKVIESSLHLSSECISMRDRSAVRAGLQFLFQVATNNMGLSPDQQLMKVFLRGNEQRTLRSLIRGLADNIPSDLCSRCGEILFSYWHIMGDVDFRQNLYHVLSSPDFPSTIATSKVKEQFLSLCLSIRSAKRYAAMVLDFAKICRAEITADALVVYEGASSRNVLGSIN